MVLNIGSWNVRGLGSPVKRAAVYDGLDTLKVEIACLQETHLTKDTKNNLWNKRYQHQFHSTYTSYSRGVSTLIGSGVAFICRQCRIDEEGRYVFLHCVIENLECVLANLYIPPPFKLDIMYNLMEFIIDKAELPVIVVGDFNMVLDNKIDRFPGGKQSQRKQENRLKQFLQEAGLLDMWRTRNPRAQQFSCCSSSCASLSRIDLVLGNGLASQVIK